MAVSALQIYSVFSGCSRFRLMADSDITPKNPQTDLTRYAYTLIGAWLLVQIIILSKLVSHLLRRCSISEFPVVL
jgi:hypothetical protein